MNEKIFYALVTAIILVGGIGLGLTVVHQETPSSNTVNSNSGITSLNLIEIMDVNYTGSGVAQPSFNEVINGSLHSASNITLSKDTKITISITTYDMGNLSVVKQFLSAQGVIGQKVSVINASVAMGSNTSKSWSTNLTTFPASKVLHTFTILQGTTVLVNIPVMAGFTEIASFYLNNTGEYSWMCEAPCGSGSTGWGGAMSANGWMEGSVTVN